MQISNVTSDMGHGSILLWGFGMRLIRSGWAAHSCECVVVNGVSRVCVCACDMESEPFKPINEHIKFGAWREVDERRQPTSD